MDIKVTNNQDDEQKYILPPASEKRIVSVKLQWDSLVNADVSSQTSLASDATSPFSAFTKARPAGQLTTSSQTNCTTIDQCQIGNVRAADVMGRRETKAKESKSQVDGNPETSN